MPATRDSNPDVDARARTWLKPDQIEELRDVCLSSAVPTYLQDRNEAIITLLYDAGLRAGELCALDVDHLDLDARTVYLPSAIQKGSPPPATLELKRETTRILRRYLRDRWKDTDALFPTRSSDRLTTRSLQRLIERLAIAADVEPQQADGGTGDPNDVTPHTLRHSVAYRII
jgi:integrase